MAAHPIKKLIAKEFTIEEKEKTITFPIGFKYIYLVDPETGKVYEPKPGWEVTGDNLERLFQEVDTEERIK